MAGEIIQKRRVVFALLFLWIILATIPRPPQALGTGLEPSWQYALNLAHAQHLAFGKDVVFTFGPLGYLFYPVPTWNAAFPAFAVGWAVYALFLFGMVLIWRALGHRWVVVVCWAVLSGAMLAANLPFDRMQLAFLSLAIGIVALLASRGNAKGGYIILAGTVAGLMPLFKTNEGIAACAVFYALSASNCFTRTTEWRKAWRFALVPPVAFLAGFALAEGSVSSIWTYMIRSLQLAIAYSEAMAIAGPLYQVLLAVFSLLFLAFLIPLVAHCRRDLVKGFLPATATAFFAFKSGLVRQDNWHADLLQIKLAVAGLFLLVCVRNLRDQRLLLTYVAASFCAGAIVFTHIFPAVSHTARNRADLHDTPANLSANVHFLSTWNRLNAQNRQLLDELRMDAAVSNLVSGGTVDSLPYELDIVPANGWRWNPRPVFQSYSAFIPMLDQLNASHLASRDSAEHIIMQWDDVDDKQPLLDDPASWRSLFDHYDVELTRPDFLVLKRRDSPRYSDPRPTGSATTTWRSDIAVLKPSDFALTGFTLMRVGIDKSPWGVLRGAFFRNSPIYLGVTYASGRQDSWRVTRANLAEGALIGYLPEEVSETLPYFGHMENGLPDRVVCIRFETQGQLEFSSAIHISWYVVDFRPAPQGH